MMHWERVFPEGGEPEANGEGGEKFRIDFYWEGEPEMELERDMESGAKHL